MEEEENVLLESIKYWNCQHFQLREVFAWRVTNDLTRSLALNSGGHSPSNERPYRQANWIALLLYSDLTETTCAFYDIRIGLTTNTSEMTLCNTDSQYVSKIVECQQCIVGQFVHFQLNNNVNCHLHICEVEIFAVKHML